VYVYDLRCVPALPQTAAPSASVPSASDLNMLRALLESHTQLTGSRLARAILRRDRRLSGFHRLARHQETSAALGTGRAVNE